MISTVENVNDEKHIQAMAELAKIHNKEKNLRDIEDVSRLIQKRITEIFNYHAQRFIYRFLRGAVDFKINEYLTFKPNKVVITIGEKQRIFTLVKRKEVNTKLIGLIADGYKLKSIVRLYFEGIKKITIPEGAVVSRGGSGKDHEDDWLFLETIGKSLNVDKSNISMAYVQLESAIKELLIEINRDKLETKEELDIPFKNLGSQVDTVADKLMEEADIKPEDRQKHYDPVVKKAEVVKKKRN